MTISTTSAGDFSSSQLARAQRAPARHRESRRSRASADASTMTSMAERARAMFNGVESSASRAVAHARKLSSGSLGSRAGSSGDLASVATNGDASPREDAAPTDRAASPSPLAPCDAPSGGDASPATPAPSAPTPDDDEADIASAIDAVRTSVDAREMADLGESLDRLESIPTLSLDDFLQFQRPGGAGSSDAGTSVPPSEGPSRPESPRGHYDQDTDLEVPEEVDPRVGAALDELNDAMSRVNELEGELIAARRRRKTTRADQEKRLASVERALSSSVRASVPYFHRRALANLYQVRSLDALRTYERAHDMHASAKRSFAALERRMRAHSPGGGGADAGTSPSASPGTFDTELMIASSDAISKVVEMETMKKRAARAHARNTKLATEAVDEARRLQRQHGKSVERARPYFTAKAQAEAACESAEAAVKDAAARLAEGKKRYHAAMDNLANISEEVHERREREKAERRAKAAEEESAIVERRERLQEEVSAKMKIAAEASATRDGNRVSHESRTSVEAVPETDDVVSIEPAEEEVSARRSTPSSSSPSSPRSAEDAARNRDEEEKDDARRRG